jgi:hypothetical protein
VENHQKHVVSSCGDGGVLSQCLDAPHTFMLNRQEFGFDGEAGELSITFRPTGIKALGEELAQQEEAAV